MQTKSCPHCRTRSGLNHYSVIIFSFENLHLVLLLTFVVAAFGEKFGYSLSSTAFFSLLAIIPLVCSVSKKLSCDNCGLDFREAAKKAQSRL